MSNVVDFPRLLDKEKKLLNYIAVYEIEGEEGVYSDIVVDNPVTLQLLVASIYRHINEAIGNTYNGETTKD
jgi:hypothetical protein